MKTTYGILALALGFGALGAAACAAGAGAARDDGATTLAGGAVTMWTDSTELFLEHPALVVGAPDKFAVHLTDLTDFEPLRSGRVALRFLPRGGGEPVVVVQDSARSPGIYGPAPEFRQAGLYDLTIEVESPQSRDVIRVPGLRVYASADESPKEEAGGDGGIPFLKEQQWRTAGFRTVFATRGEVAESFATTGEIVPAAGRFAQVTAPISGLVEPGGLTDAPAPGQRVQRGAQLAVLTPALDAGGSAFAEARRALREAEDEHARATRLYEVEAIPLRRLREAEIRLQAARETVAGLGAGAPDSSGKLAVRAPIAGVIAGRFIVPGSRAEAGVPLFTIVDPSVVWLTVNVPAEKAPVVGLRSGAAFRVAGFDRELETRRLVSVGSMVDSVSRTVPVVYEVLNSDGAVKIGAAASVSVRTTRRAAGVIVPGSAILDEDGRPIAYVQVSGERFEKRELVTGGSERGMTLVVSGIREGERVVSGAAYQVRLASLSTAVPAHGHEH